MKYQEEWWKKISWQTLDFCIETKRLVLRHNKDLQFGYTPQTGQSLASALQFMEEYCANHPKGNPKIRGVKKILEHTKIDNIKLIVYLKRKIAREHH